MKPIVQVTKVLLPDHILCTIYRRWAAFYGRPFKRGTVQTTCMANDTCMSSNARGMLYRRMVLWHWLQDNSIIRWECSSLAFNAFTVTRVLWKAPVDNRWIFRVIETNLEWRSARFQAWSIFWSRHSSTGDWPPGGHPQNGIFSQVFITQRRARNWSLWFVHSNIVATLHESKTQPYKNAYFMETKIWKCSSFQFMAPIRVAISLK